MKKGKLKKKIKDLQRQIDLLKDEVEDLDCMIEKTNYNLWTHKLNEGLKR